MERISQSQLSQPNFVFSELKRTQIFSVLDEPEQKELFENCKIFIAQKNDVIIRQGYNADYIFFITSGSVRRTRIDPSGKRIISGFAFGSDFSAYSGDFVGASITEIYPYSVEAITETVLCQFRRQVLLDLMKENPYFEKLFFELISDEYLKTQAHLDIVMDGPVRTRLARFLLYLARRIGQPAEGGTLVILGMSRQDIGDHIAHSVESVSRAFTKLRDAGLLSYPEGQPNRVIVDEAKLKKLAHEHELPDD